MTSGVRHALGATLLYTIAACAITWPLVAVMHRNVAADMGDPVLNCWILLWTGGQVMAFLSGDVGALSRFWQGNIFYPEPLTLAYSEHLVPQMVQALPVLAATNNVILAYNLVFLSTFVLAGLGTFLLVRDLTGRPLAALVAGLAFAFAPYRFDQLSHVQVLSAQWMPFVLFGFRRYLITSRRRALAGAALALIAQNLSCGYYALFFSPFAGAYVLYELAVRRRLNDWIAWRAFAIAGVAVTIGTLPFLLPYVAVRSSGVGVRSLGEIAMFSADVHAFATAPLKSWLWGERIMAFPRAEGQAFPGFAILALAVIGVIAGFLRSPKRVRPVAAPVWRQVVIGALVALLAGHLYALACVFVTGSFTLPSSGAWMVWHYAGQFIINAIVLAVGLWLLTMGARRSRGESSDWPWAFYAVAVLAAATLAMGPFVTVKGTVVAQGPYLWLMDFVPGFDGLRVPARYMTLVTLFLAVLAGLGASELLTRAKRLGTALVIVLAACILIESWPATFQTNERLASEGLELTPAQLEVGRRLPPIYKTIRDHDGPIVLLEFPFGRPAWDLYAVFYAGYHRKPLVNGYSGFFPESNQSLGHAFNLRAQDPPAAWRAVLESGATHVLVHEAAYPENHQQEVTHWLQSSGAREILVDGRDRLFTVR